MLFQEYLQQIKDEEALDFSLQFENNSMPIFFAFRYIS